MAGRDVLDYPVINWELALEQTGGDVEFLQEVLTDLIAEADEAEESMRSAITTSGIAYTTLKQAAHKIKGSASYLCCEQLREVSLHLQDLGHAGESNKLTVEQQRLIVHKFNIYVQCLTVLKKAIEAGP
eukprot:gene33850-43735_t